VLSRIEFLFFVFYSAIFMQPRNTIACYFVGPRGETNVNSHVK